MLLPAIVLHANSFAKLLGLEVILLSSIRDFERDAVVDADVCIVGSGAAGITLAREFLHTRVQVVVLEAGGQNLEAEHQDPYKSHVIGLAHGGIHQGRARVLGGSTTLWAGQALPFFTADFAKRAWVPYSGWPITRETLLPFYRRAEDVLQVPHTTNDAASWPAGRMAPPAYAPGTLRSYFSQFTTTPNFIQKYGEALRSAENIRVIRYANVVSLEANPQATRLEHVVASSLDGHRISVRARRFIVCGGGIESARILLMSNSVEPNGIGNQHDTVGRYFQDHPGVAVPVTPLPGGEFEQRFNSFRINGIRHCMKIVASHGLQQREGITHVGSEIYYPPEENDSIGAAKELLKIGRNRERIRELPGALSKVLSRPHRVLAAAYRHYVRHVPASVGSSAPMLGIGGEQEPNPQSRITLAQDKDALGNRRAVLDWRLTSNDSRSMEVFLGVVAEEWKRLGIATVHADRVVIAGREKGLHGGFVDSNHHMGTTRMGDDPKTSVVDANCRVHGYDNLYVGSSSVFPTGGFSNPTLTMIALCLRLADELKQQLC